MDAERCLVGQTTPSVGKHSSSPPDTGQVVSIGTKVISTCQTRQSCRVQKKNCKGNFHNVTRVYDLMNVSPK